MNNIFKKQNIGLIIYLITCVIATALFINSLYVGGITWDEPGGPLMVTRHLNSALDNIPFNRFGQDIYYGIINILPGLFLSYIFGNYYVCSHITIFIMGVATSFYVYKILCLCKVRTNIAYFSAALLLLEPNWLGFSFFDFKDTPTAFFFTLYSYSMCKTIIMFNEKQKLKVKSLWLLIFTGTLLSSVKFALFPIIFINTVFLAICPQLKYQFSSNLLSSKLKFIVIVLGFTLIADYILLPGSWHQPIGYGTTAILIMSKFPFDFCTITYGTCVSTLSPEWNSFHYLLIWYTSQLPLLYMLLLLPGFIFIFKAIKNNSITKWLAFIVLIQFLLLPTLISMHNSPLYNGIRQTLFVLPAIVIVVGFGLEFLFSEAVTKYVSTKILVAILLLFLIPISIDNVRLAPFQYVYFNEISRQFINSSNMDNDFWGFSLRDAYNHIGSDNYSEKVDAEPGLIDLYYSSDIIKTQYDKNQPLTAPVNVIGLKLDNFINPKDCKLIYAVQREFLFKSDPIVLSKAYHCIPSTGS